MTVKIARVLQNALNYYSENYSYRNKCYFRNKKIFVTPKWANKNIKLMNKNLF